MYAGRALCIVNHLCLRNPRNQSIRASCCTQSLLAPSLWSEADIEQICTNVQNIRRRKIVSPAAVRRAAVLIPLCNQNGKASILFTKRSEHVGSHKGHVSFPGGMQDPEDTDLIATALRETEEEIGIPRSAIRVLGLFHDAYSITRVPVTPVLAFLPDLNLSTLKVSEREIDSVFTLTLEDLLDTAKQESDEETSRRHNVPMKVFTAGPAPVWGLTAFILDEALRTVLRRAAQK